MGVGKLNVKLTVQGDLALEPGVLWLLLESTAAIAAAFLCFSLSSSLPAGHSGALDKCPGSNPLDYLLAGASSKD